MNDDAPRDPLDRPSRSACGPDGCPAGSAKGGLPLCPGCVLAIALLIYAGVDAGVTALTGGDPQATAPTAVEGDSPESAPPGNAADGKPRTAEARDDERTPDG